MSESPKELDYRKCGCEIHEHTQHFRLCNDVRIAVFNDPKIQLKILAASNTCPIEASAMLSMNQMGLIDRFF